MNITYQIEPWHQYYRDCQDLWAEHYNEIISMKSKMRLDPDIVTYEALDRLGMLQILTIRDNGKMVGYQISTIKTHIHDRNLLCAYEDSYYLSPATDEEGRKIYRKGMTGVRLITESLDRLIERGVQKIIFMNDFSKDVAVIFKRIGFQMTGEVYTMWVDGNGN